MHGLLQVMVAGPVAGPPQNAWKVMLSHVPAVQLEQSQLGAQTHASAPWIFAMQFCSSGHG